MAVEMLLLQLFLALALYRYVRQLTVQLGWTVERWVDDPARVLMPDAELGADRRPSFRQRHAEASCGGDSDRVDRPAVIVQWPQLRRYRGLAGGCCQAGNGPGDGVVVMIGSHLPRKLRQFDRRTQQARQPILQLLLQGLRLCRADVTGDGRRRPEKQQGKRDSAIKLQRPASRE